MTSKKTRDKDISASEPARDAKLLRKKPTGSDLADQARAQRQRRLSVALRLGFWEWDEAADKPIYFSDEFASIFGIDPGNLSKNYRQHQDFYACIHEDDLEHYKQFKDRNSKHRFSAGDSQSFNYRVVWPGGQIRHIHELEYCAFDDQDKVAFSYGVIQDITEHQQAVEGLTQSEERYSSLFNQLPLGVQEEDYRSIKRVVDKLRFKGIENLRQYLEQNPKLLREMVGGTRITRVNEALLKMHEASSVESFLGVEDDVDEWWDAEWIEFYAAEIAALAGPDHYYEAERVDTRVDGSYFETRSITTLVRGYEDSWERVITIHEDITTRKRNEAEMLEARKLAEKANAAKSEFLSSMSHELRTPLNAILGFSHLFEFDQNLDQHQQANAREINRAGKHLLLLVDEVLDLSRIEAGELEINFETVSVLDILSESIAWVNTLAQQYGVTINFDTAAAAGLALRVKADKVRLKQAILNLLTNAVKYNKKQGAVTIEVERSDRGYVRIGVRDTGEGIAPERLQELFQPFNRLGAEQGEIEGTGIGLVITKQLVKLMRGRLVVDSVVGEGTTFRVHLLSAPEAEVGAALESVAEVPKIVASSGPAKGKNHRILVAEDNAINRELIAAQLALMGFEADYATNGEEALRLWQAGDYQLIFTDIRMPVMDGFKLISQIRALETDSSEPVAIVAITANVMERDVKLCFEVGANHVIAKPTELDELRAALEKWTQEKNIPEPDMALVPAPATTGVDEVVNLSVLQRSVGNHFDIHCQLMQAYVEALPQSLDDIQAAFAWSNNSQLSDLAHKLKSSTRSIGALQLADMCDALEKAGRNSRQDSIEYLLPRIAQQAQLVTNFVQAYCRRAKPLVEEVDLVDGEDAFAEIDLTVLLLDDDYIIHRVTSLMLKDLGIKAVMNANTGPQALEMIDQVSAKVDLVICDLNMPEMDGIEFIRHLASRQFDGFLILTSGEEVRILKTVEKLAIEQQLQVLGVLQKPFTQLRLREMIDLLGQINTESSLSGGEIFSADDLLRAINGDQFEAFFQPKVDAHTGQVIGVESLARWMHPTFGIINPYAFIPLAEENNLIFELTQLICKKAMENAARLKQAGYQLNMAINISVDALTELEWPDEIYRRVEALGMQSSEFTFEITESRLMKDTAVALDILSRLSLMRFNLSIDDFGTGYSSMEKLQRIPFSELKIDRAFVKGVESDASARAIVESSVLLAKNLEMKIVAEGVETLQEWESVKALGCDQIQGYYVARPLSAEQLLDWLAEWDPQQHQI